MTKGQAKLGGQHLYGLVSPQLNSWTCCVSLQSFALLNPDFLGFSFKLGLPGLNSKLSALRMVQGMFRWFLQPSVCDPMNFKCPTNIQTVCFLVASPLVAYLKPLVAFPQWLLAAGTCRGCHRCASLPSLTGSGNPLFRHLVCLPCLSSVKAVPAPRHFWHLFCSLLSFPMMAIWGKRITVLLGFGGFHRVWVGNPNNMTKPRMGWVLLATSHGCIWLVKIHVSHFTFGFCSMWSGSSPPAVSNRTCGESYPKSYVR